MNLLVENRTSITKPIFMEWRKSSQTATYKKTMFYLTIVMVVVLAGAMFFFYSQGMAPVMVIGETLFMSAIYFWALVLMPRNKNKRQYKALCQSAGGSPERTARFYSDHFTVTTESGKMREFYYDQIHTLKETENLYVLANESDVDILVSKNGFILGSIEQIKEKLPEKCVFTKI